MGSQLIVCPELFATGYSFLNREQAGMVAERADGPTFRTMRAVAIELKAYVSWGYIEHDHGDLFNAATLVGPDGVLLSQYRKVNLWGNDFLWAKPGLNSAPIVQTELGRMSIVVCRDLRNKIPQNIPRTASKSVPLFDDQPIDIVAASVNWGKGGYPSTSWMDFAVDNGCTLVIANRWGEERNGKFTQDFGQGGSIIIEKNWTCHTGGASFGEDCVVTGVIEHS